MILSIRRFHLLYFLVFAVGLSSCQTAPKIRPGASTPAAGGGSKSETSNAGGDQPEGSQPSTPETRGEIPPVERVYETKSPLNVALIFGPGGLRSYAHAGVAQEILQAKLPLKSVAGLEWGSLVAAIIARKPLPFEAEWQMMKLKEEDFVETSLLGKKTFRKQLPLNEILERLVGNDRVEQSSLGFACPSYNLQNRKAYIMDRGPYKNLLPFCLAFPPMLSPTAGSVGDPTQLNAIAKHLRAKGANFVIYVHAIDSLQNAIADPVSPESIQWFMIQQSLENQMSGVDYVIRVQADTPLTDFGNRRNLLQAGKAAAKAEMPNLLKKISEFDSQR